MTRLRCAFATAFLASALILGGLAARAADYPRTVTDVLGRAVTISQEPERIALQDGRDAMMLALLDRAEPMRRVAVWNNILSRDDVNNWATLAATWPDATRIPDMGFGDNGQVNLEQLLAARPQVVVAQSRAAANLREAGVEGRLAELGIPLVYVDSFEKPVPNAVDSVVLLGRVLNREHEAAEYATYYDAHLARLRQASAGAAPQRVFVEALAGRSGLEQCCFTHGRVGWGLLVEAIGAENIGSALLSKLTGDVTLETVLAQKPDVIVMTGTQSNRANNALVPFGYGADPAKLAAAMARLEARPGFAQTSAARTGRVFGIWHLFYNHPYNIVGLEHLAKIAYPKETAAIDPDATFREILARFTRIPDRPFVHAMAAPRVD